MAKWVMAFIPEGGGSPQTVPGLTAEYDEATHTLRLRSASANSTLDPFRVNLQSGKTIMRSWQVQEQSDSADTNCGRAGPDNAAPGTPLATTEPTARIMRGSAQTWVDDPSLGDGWNGRNASGNEAFAIIGETCWYAAGPQTPTSRPGRFAIRATRSGKILPTLDDFEVTSNGEVRVLKPDGLMVNTGTEAAPVWKTLTEYVTALVGAPPPPPPPPPGGYGPELVTDGGFDSGAAWTKAYWSVSGGKAIKTVGNAGGISQVIGSLVAGASYEVSWTLEQYVAGTFYARLSGGGNNADGPVRQADGTFTEVLVAQAGMDTVKIIGNTDANGRVDNISVKQRL